MNTPNTRPAVVELRERIQRLKVRPRAIGPYFPSASERSTGICREEGCHWAPCMKWPGVEIARLTVRLPLSSPAASPRGHAEKYCGA